MNIIQVIIQGIIQGFTEFLPVSSSGHLALWQALTGQSGEQAFLLTLVLHLGTLLAIFIAFRSTLWELLKEVGYICADLYCLCMKKPMKKRENTGSRRMLVMLIISLVMLVPFYIFMGDYAKKVAVEGNITGIGIFFLYTAVMLFIASWYGKRVKNPKEQKEIKVTDSILVGIFQGVALLPGVSRSGSCISGGLFSGFSQELAVKYSFILGIPTILAGCLSEFKDAHDAGVLTYESSQMLTYLVGFIVAALVGLFSIWLVKVLLKANKFSLFAYYMVALGVASVVYGIVIK